MQICVPTVKLVSGDVGGQAREGLPAGPADPHHHDVALRLDQDPVQAAEVLEGEVEEHEVHGLPADLVVLGE